MPKIPNTVIAVMAVIVALGAMISYELFSDGRWLGATVGGIVYPALTLIDWWVIRRRSDDEGARVADHMLGNVIGAMVLLAMASHVL
jgi:hypothetical protein